MKRKFVDLQEEAEILKEVEKRKKKSSVDLRVKRRLVTWSWKGSSVKGLCHGLGIRQLKFL